MKQFIDFIPLILFFIVYKIDPQNVEFAGFNLSGIYGATATLILASVIVYGAEAEGKYFVGDFAAHFGGLGLSDVYGRNPDPRTYTTFNARTYLQPQLNKAVKPEDKFTSPLVDRNPKDHILFYEKDAKLHAPPTRDNTGRGFYDNDIMFPTLTFPSDHAITKAAVALVAAD